jgi:hypothetical protein
MGFTNQSSGTAWSKRLSQSRIPEEYCANEKTEIRMKKATEKIFFIINTFLTFG